MADTKDCTQRVIITNGVVVSGGIEKKADILVENGRIVKTKPNLLLGSLLRRAESELLDAEGCYVFPGFIDAFTRLETKAFIPGEKDPVCSPDDFESGTKAALAGGTTSIINCAVQKKGQSLQDALDEQHTSALHKSSCNYGFHIAVTSVGTAVRTDEEAAEKNDEDTERQEGAQKAEQKKEQMSPAEALKGQMEKTVMRGVSSYAVYMTGENIQLSDPEIFEILNAAKEHKALICCHCENADMVKHLVEEQLENRKKRPSSHPVSRPPAVEAEAISRFLALAQMADIPVYILNVSAKQSLEQIKLAKKRGQNFFAGTCPHYLLLTDSLYRKGGFAGARFICNPPLRKKPDLKALQKELMKTKADKAPGAKDNSCLDVICSNHAVFDFAEQEKAAKKNFSKVAPGISGAQYRAALIFTAACTAQQDKTEKKELAPGFRLTPAQFSALMSENPAKIFGLYPSRGSLNRGAAADITVWNPDVSTVIGDDNNLHRGGYTPYEGIEIKGQAKYVLLGGKVCVKNGRVIEERQGSYLFRKTGYPAFE
ncbi:amidohydrolase family protein [Treponema sp. OMZ 840]|uniref:amidohydrolase family protein n=1 Tax=Treponema sp. OMZ 840 TaxID=244313 RepID=UPI003D89C59A